MGVRDAPRSLTLVADAAPSPRERGMRVMTVCEVSPPRVEVPLEGRAALAALVDAQEYREVRLKTDAGVLRLGVDVPLLHEGRLRLDLTGATPRLLWNDTAPPLRSVEEHGRPDALDDFALERRGLPLREGVTSFEVPVASATNHGLRVVVWLHDARGDSGVDTSELDGTAFEVEVLRPDGSVAGHGRKSAAHHVDLTVVPDAPGPWTVRATTRDPPPGGGAWSATLTLRY